MKTLTYQKIDAFTAEESLGNPAACIYLELEQILKDDEMLAIAKQHKGFVSEVVYCSPISTSEFGLIFYSSECEVDFCGHGTIACMYSLIQDNPELLNQKEITIRTRRKGALTVYNDIPARDAVYITAPEPSSFAVEIDSGDIAGALSLSDRQISPAYPIDIIDAGLKTLIVPVASLADEIHVFPNEQDLKEFCVKHGLDIVLIYSLETAGAQNIAHTRVFAPKFGYLEDPATGSGNSAFGYYMLKNGLWDGTPVTVEQGGADRVFNSVSLATQGHRVLFGGKATTRIKGMYYLNDE
jgi:PhzF family phenazine biosynthesis protein